MELKGAKLRNLTNLCKDMTDDTSNMTPLNVNIPYYQRPYKWGEEQIKNIINDFEKNKNENDEIEYFIGSVVLVNSKQNNRLDVIDGQQRVTTMFLLNYLKLLLLRAYVEESIALHRPTLINKLSDFVQSYKTLFGASLSFELEEFEKKVNNELDEISELEEDEKLAKYNDLLASYQKLVGLPEKNFTDMDAYKKLYKQKTIKHFLKGDLSLKYSRDSYNNKIKDALSDAIIILSKDKNPILMFAEEVTDDQPIKKQYIDALNIEFNEIVSRVPGGKSPLQVVDCLIEGIDEIIKNVQFCVIMTGNENDAYTLFEVLNDRSLKIDDLDLVKNIFLKKYCKKSGDDEDIIDANLEILDVLWGDIFTIDHSFGDAKMKLITYLGTVYLTADETMVNKKIDKYREKLESMYFDMHYPEGTAYTFENIKNDISVYKMLKILFKEFDIPTNNASASAIKAENNWNNSITYRTLHLLNAFGMDSVMPAITNVIIKKYFETYIGDIDKIVDLEHYREYVRDLAKANPKDENKEIFYDINECSFLIWKTALLADGFVIPRKVACDIINKVSFKNYEYSKFSLNKYVNDLNKDLDKWTEEWSYGKKVGDLKAKILFINLLRTNKEDGKLLLPPTFYSFVTEKLSLDHLEANNPPEGSLMTYYFIPKDNNDDRAKWVNGLGNFMILDQENNNFKNN